MKKFNADSFDIFGKDWALLTAGDINNFNTMTISWGGLGTLWSKPVCTVYVKPIRYTYEYMESSEYFTVSFYDEKYRKELNILGVESGKNVDKVSKVGFTAVQAGECVTFDQAKITILCRKLYSQDLMRDKIPEEDIKKYYTPEEPHRMYIGEVIDIIEDI